MRKRSVPESAVEGIAADIKERADNRKFGKLVDTWDNAFKKYVAKATDYLGFKEAIENPKTSDEEKDRCKKLLEKIEPDFFEAKAAERKARDEYNKARKECNMKPIEDTAVLSLTPQVRKDFLGAGLEGSSCKDPAVEGINFEALFNKASDLTDEFLMNRGRQIAQIVDGSRDKAIALYTERITELGNAAKNISKVNQKDLAFKIPGLKPDGTVDRECMDLKDRIFKGETLDKKDLQKLIAKGLAYYGKLLKDSKAIDSDEMMGSFNQMMKDLRTTLNLEN